MSSTASTSSESDICPTHFLTELTSLDDLSFPTNSSKRIKFTCISASPRNLLLGTSTGTVYVFSRFATKNRNKLTQVPVHVFTTKDGPVNRLLVSNNEELVAVGSDSGRVSIAALGQNKQPANVIHTVAGDARKPDKVTSLCWSLDSKILYTGHASGVIHLHQLGVRYVFRPAFEVVASFEGEVVQLDSSGLRLLISTTTASHVFDMEEKKSYQVGKKSRNGKMGACFLTSRDVTVVSDGNQFLVAARPNGRLWESNQAGVVYRSEYF
uniref:WD_REPEATS_REGION domain-containing protein n=1 Tax=Heterorhabditis bacteriophora TaxID=37862 RepID=A0A1I7XQL3_HETBA